LGDDLGCAVGYDRTAQRGSDMTSDNGDKDYLDKLQEVDGKIRQRLDQEFGQIRVIAVVAAVLIGLLIAVRWLLGS
jgi:hypothetical protein